MSTLSPLPYKGTRDFYPSEKRLQNYVFSIWKDVVSSYGYEEYGAPILENIEIYAAKSGQELVNEQTYSFTDRGGRTVSIRPEMTPSISRMVAARRQELAYPARLFSIANFMRYERPQRGREREFWQLNVDIFGVDGIQADIEIVTIADTIMKKFGAKAKDYEIRINNRKLIQYTMVEYFGLDSVGATQMIKLFDKRDKINEQDFKQQALSILVSKQEADYQKVLSIIDAKSIDELPSVLQKSTALIEIKELFKEIKANGVKSAIFDPGLMRGLDYYTGTVFEVFDTNPENNRALFGGGRYDGLVALFGAEPISAVGFAPGYSAFENFLTTHKLVPKLKPGVDAYIVVINDAFSNANSVANVLRESNLAVEVDITGKKIDKQIKSALKKSIPYLIFVGDKDSLDGKFSLKDISTENEEKLTLKQIIDKLS